MQTLWYVLDSVCARFALTAAVLTLFSALFLSLLPLPHPPCCGGFTSSSNFQLWFYKKSDGSNGVDERLRRKNTLLPFISVSVPRRRAPQLATWHPSGRYKWTWHSWCVSQHCSFRQSIFNPQPTTLLSDVSNSWCGFHQNPQKQKYKKKTEQVRSPVTFSAFIPTCEYLEWWLHRIMVWASGIMRFLGERGQTRGWRALLGKS